MLRMIFTQLNDYLENHHIYTIISFFAIIIALILLFQGIPLEQCIILVLAFIIIPKESVCLLSFIFKIIYNFFDNIRFYCHYIHIMMIIPIMISFLSIISMVISIIFIQHIWSDPSPKYLSLYLLTDILCSLIPMTIFSLFYSSYILEKYDHIYELTMISFIIGVLFTLIIGLKVILASHLDFAISSKLGIDLAKKYANGYNFTINELINVVIYWLFSLSLCFQTTYKSIRNVKDLKKQES